MCNFQLSSSTWNHIILIQTLLRQIYNIFTKSINISIYIYIFYDLSIFYQSTLCKREISPCDYQAPVQISTPLYCCEYCHVARAFIINYYYSCRYCTRSKTCKSCNNCMYCINVTCYNYIKIHYPLLSQLMTVVNIYNDSYR